MCGTDDTPVPKATVIDYTKPKQLIEMTAYPRIGDPNPLVKLAIAPVAGGDVCWIDLSDYAKEESFILARRFLVGQQTAFTSASRTAARPGSISGR